jgi:MFS family permease
MAPQGIGAAVVMPLAGRLSDRFGPGKVVITGLLVAMAGTLVYTDLGPHTSYVLLGFSLFVRGLGFGFVMMPAFAAAYQTLSRPQVPRAATALNIVQRVGGSIGTALLAVVLEHQISVQLPHASGGLQAATEIPEAVRVVIAGPLSTAFANAFWWAFGLTAVALIPAFLLPRHPAAASPDGPPPDEALLIEA